MVTRLIMLVFIERFCHKEYSQINTQYTQALMVEKLLARLSFRQIELQNDRQDKNNMPPTFNLGGIKKSNINRNPFS